MFFLGLLVSNVGSWMQLTAMSLLVYRITGKATDVGLVVATQFVPTLLLGAWAGAVADRVDRRKMTLVTQALLAVQALVLGVLELSGHINIPAIYVLSLAVGVVNAMDNPARRGFVTELVDEVDIPNAISLNTAVMTGSRIFGPALGAVLTKTIDIGWCFIINGISFVAILVALFSMDLSKLRPAVTAQRGGTPVRDALRFIRGNSRVLMVFLVLGVVSTFAFNYSVSLVRLADKRFGDKELYGWLLAAVSVGSLTGSLRTARLQVVTVRYFLANTALLGVSGIAMAWSHGLLMALVLAVPLGIGGAGFVAGTNAIAQQECPPEMRSRLLALMAVAFLGSTPIGAPITGVIGDHVSAEWSLAYGGVISLLCVAVAAFVLTRSRGQRELGQQLVNADSSLDHVVPS